MNASLQERLQAEITRKQFLQYFGIVLLTVLGFNNILSLFGLRKHLVPYASQTSEKTEHHGFGSSRFGD